MTSFPDGFTLRPPTLDDVEDLTNLVNAHSSALIGRADTSPAMTRSWLEEEDRDLTLDNWLLVAPDGRFAAYCDFSEYDPYDVGEFDYAIHPDFRGLGIEEQLLRLGESRARESLLAQAPPGARVWVETRAWEPDTTWQHLALSHGYTRSRVWHRMQADLREPVPAPRVPDGITIRTLVVGQDEPAIHDAYEVAQGDEWGHVTLTFKQFMFYMVEREEEFDPTLWFLAFDEATGELAGYVLTRWERPGEPEDGHIRNVGVKREFRRRGIAEALVLTALGEFQRRGKHTASLAVDADSPTGADKLYYKIGMRPVQTEVIFEKELRAAS